MRYVVIVECTRDTDVEQENVSTVHGPFRSFAAAEQYADRLQPRTRLYREAVGRAGVLLLGYEESFVAWKADVAEWEREWKS